MLTKNQIIRLFQFGEVTFILFNFSLIYLLLNNQTGHQFINELGEQYGRLALTFLSITLTPGIVRRLGVLPVLIRLIMPFRRHFGIFTYLFALFHSIFIYYLGLYLSGNFPPATAPLYVVFGFSALLSMTPLFLTSNDYSLRLLKTYWHKLHKLVYLTALLVLFHLIFIDRLLALIALVLVFAEVISHLAFWYKKRQLTQA